MTASLIKSWVFESNLTVLVYGLSWFFFLIFFFISCKTPQITKTFLCILTDLDNPVVWVVFILNSYPLGTVSNAPIMACIIILLMFHSFCSSLARFKYFHFLLSSPCSSLKQQNPPDFIFFFLIDSRFSLLAKIGWSPCTFVPENVIHLIFLERFFVVHVLFIHMVKF